MEHLKEVLISSSNLYKGKIIDVKIDKVQLPNGKEANREVVCHPGATAVVAVTDGGEIVLVRQWRHAVNRLSIEIPAGKLDSNEDPLECAKRELEEETGYQAKDWQHLVSFYNSPGFCNEIMHLYLARNLTVSKTNPDEDEFVETLFVPLADVMAMIQKGEIVDAKSIVGIYHFNYIYQNR